jgi:hypothetical protein
MISKQLAGRRCSRAPAAGLEAELPRTVFSWRGFSVRKTLFGTPYGESGLIAFQPNLIKNQKFCNLDLCRVEDYASHVCFPGARIGVAGEKAGHPLLRGNTVRSGSRPADRAGAVGRTRHGAADRVGDQGQTTRAPSPDGEDRWELNLHRNENRWLRDRVEELTQELRLRTIILGGALALSTLMVVGNFSVLLFYEPEPPTASLELPTAPDATGRPPPPAGTMEHPLEVERSQALPPVGQGIEAFKKTMDARYQAAIVDLDLAVRRVEALSKHLRACSPGGESTLRSLGRATAARSLVQGTTPAARDPQLPPLKTAEDNSPAQSLIRPWMLRQNAIAR